MYFNFYKQNSDLAYNFLTKLQYSQRLSAVKRLLIIFGKQNELFYVLKCFILDYTIATNLLLRNLQNFNFAQEKWSLDLLSNGRFPGTI